MRLGSHIALLCMVVLLRSGAPRAVADQKVSWRTLQPGVELASIPAGKMPSGKAGLLYVVRVDAERAKVGVGLASEGKTGAQTAGEWCRASRFAVAINLGMYQTDYRSNVGYLRHGRHVNNPRWNGYRSAVAIHPSKPSLPPVLWLDLQSSKPDPRLAEYDIVVQNLRLISKDRKNVWSRSDRRWSEAALAIDSRGRLLFLFTRVPYAMRDFNDLLLKLPLDVAGAMHVEGGPQASLSIHVPGLDLDLSGSYETGYLADDSNAQQWPIPNVLGVVREEKAEKSKTRRASPRECFAGASFLWGEAILRVQGGTPDSAGKNAGYRGLPRKFAQKKPGRGVYLDFCAVFLRVRGGTRKVQGCTFKVRGGT